MADLTDRAKDMMLAHVFVDAVIGLTRANKEIGDRGYERQPIGAMEPEGEKLGLRSIRNSDEIRFGPWGDDAAGTIVDWFISTEKGTMATGKFLGPDGKPHGRLPLQGDELVIRSRELVVGLKPQPS